MIIDGEKLLTPAEVAEQLSVSIKTLANWRSEKKGPKYTLFNETRCFYSQKDIDHYIAKRAKKIETVYYCDCLDLFAIKKFLGSSKKNKLRN